MASVCVEAIPQQEEPDRCNWVTTSLFCPLLGAGATVLCHPIVYVKLLIQVGHEPLPATFGRNLLGTRVLYLPGFFTYAWRKGCEYRQRQLDRRSGFVKGTNLKRKHTGYLKDLPGAGLPFHRHIVKIDGKCGLFRGLGPRIACSTVSCISREAMKKTISVATDKSSILKKTGQSSSG